MKKGYKDSPLGSIPIDWEVVKLGEIVVFSNGKGHEKFIDEKGKYVVVNSKFISTEGRIRKFSNKNLCPLKAGDITMVMSDVPNGKALGKCFLVDQNHKYSLNQRICSIKGLDCIQTKFLYYILNRNKYYLAFDNGVGQTNLRKEEVICCPVPLPPLAEQKRIAEVLTTVDDKIDNIGKQIDQFTELKKGLMQQLLTKGIDHTEFKDSPLGSIPKDWEVVKLGDVVNNYDNKRIPLKSEDRNKRKGNYPYYGAQGIIDYIDDYIFEGQYLLIAEDGENVKSRKNDIALLANGKFWVNNHAHVINNMKTSSLIFLKYFINQMDIKPFVTGLAQPKLNKDSLNKLMILLPPLAEQQKIAEILGSVDRKIDILESKREKVVDQKKGLMQKLLTGEKRLPYKE